MTDDALTEGFGRELRRRLDQEEREYEEQVMALMARQRRLSLLSGGFLLAVVGGFTVATFIAPEFMGEPMWGGFSPAVLFAAVVIYPFTWLVALLYTIRANRLDRLE